MIRATGFIFGVLVISVVGSAFAAPLKQEPAMGALREGEVVLVDDGSCPAGKIKRVVGGNHTKVGAQNKSYARAVACRASVLSIAFSGRGDTAIGAADAIAETAMSPLGT